MSYEDLLPTACQAALQADPELQALDVRTPLEFESHHIDGATLVPLQELPMRLADLDSDKPYLLICEHGHRSLIAAQIMAQGGFAKLSNLQGGMAAWIEAGLPCVR